MYIREEIISGKKTDVIEYSSLNDFYSYICDTPFNETFRWARHSSVNGDHSFTQTHSFNEAADLFKNGWEDMAKKITQKLKVMENEIVPSTKQKSIYDVAGFQCNVPRYLQGIPTNMINKKNIPVKQKVITINKSVDYLCDVKTEQIIEESIKALQIVKKLESQGLRVNLNIVLGTFVDIGFIVKIRIKNANERMNVSKLAFPLVHPSMLRRLLFRFIEVYPKITKRFQRSYGIPATMQQIRSATPNEYLLPNFINKDVSKINCVDDLENL